MTTINLDGLKGEARITALSVTEEQSGLTATAVSWFFPSIEIYREDNSEDTLCCIERLPDGTLQLVYWLTDDADAEPVTVTLRKPNTERKA